ncbi:hypothetical protein QF044_000431 [Chryseobacterium sp. W4I1]|nr:hypothetical protein [Chryseobacterium sp. W4I1]
MYLRNNTIAHKNTSSLELYEHIYNIEHEKIYNLSMELKILYTEFNNLTTQIIYSIIDFIKKK